MRVSVRCFVLSVCLFVCFRVPGKYLFLFNWLPGGICNSQGRAGVVVRPCSSLPLLLLDPTGLALEQRENKPTHLSAEWLVLAEKIRQALPSGLVWKCVLTQSDDTQIAKSPGVGLILGACSCGRFGRSTWGSKEPRQIGTSSPSRLASNLKSVAN